MKFECILPISVSNLTFEAFGQVNDFDCSVRASLNAHTATNAEVFRDLANGRCLTDLDAEFSSLVDWARLFALLSAFFRFTLVRIYDGNPELVVSTR